jgi:hypothetical protein
MEMIGRRAQKVLLFAGLCLAVAGSLPKHAFAQEPAGDERDRKVFLRLAADSGAVGHFRFTGRGQSQLIFDIPQDDPRNELLASVTAPRTITRDIAGTIVSTPAKGDEERRYLIYWLGYKLAGVEEDRTLSPVQWDSIFQAAGRRAELRFTARGQPLGVQVSSEAVRPVAQSLANVLSGLALALPADSVAVTEQWEDELAVPIDGLDGSQKQVIIEVSYRLTELVVEPNDVKAHIEFDGEPVSISDDAGEVTGKYFGESVFSVSGGRYEQVMAIANLEVKWKDSSGLPPSRTVLEWRGQLIRR